MSVNRRIEPEPPVSLGHAIHGSHEVSGDVPWGPGAETPVEVGTGYNGPYAVRCSGTVACARKG